MSGGSGLLRRLARGGAQGGLEAASTETDLSAGRRADSLDRLAAALKAGGAEEGEDLDRLMAGAKAGLAELAAGGEALDAEMRIGVEAIIYADGSRPCVLVQDDRVDPDEPTLGDWKADVQQGRSEIAKAARATARVALPGLAQNAPDQIVGTAFVVAEGVVATNRHVLQSIATPDGCAPGGWRFLPGTGLDFGGEFERPADPARRYAPARLRFTGPDAVGEPADPALLDLAVIELAENGSGGFPEPTQISDDEDGPRKDLRIAALGFPAAPAFGSVSGVVLWRLFRNVFGVKRFAPGTVTGAPGSVAGDADPPRCFTHDASTLGGNSGSCLIDISGLWQVVGLHFGGRAQIDNYAHAVARLRDHLT